MNQNLKGSCADSEAVSILSTQLKWLDARKRHLKYPPLSNFILRWLEENPDVQKSGIPFHYAIAAECKLLSNNAYDEITPIIVESLFYDGKLHRHRKGPGYPYLYCILTRRRASHAVDDS